MAADAYRQAFEANPFNDVAIMSYGCLLAGQGKLKEGIQWVRKAIEVNPLNVRARQNLAAMEADLSRITAHEVVACADTTREWPFGISNIVAKGLDYDM